MASHFLDELNVPRLALLELHVSRKTWDRALFISDQQRSKPT